MEECSLNLFFFNLGAGADFSQQFKLDFLLDKVKAFIFCNHKTSFLLLLLATVRLISVSPS